MLVTYQEWMKIHPNASLTWTLPDTDWYDVCIDNDEDAAVLVKKADGLCWVIFYSNGDNIRAHSFYYNIVAQNFLSLLEKFKYL